jgi:hypothetical protein
MEIIIRIYNIKQIRMYGPGFGYDVGVPIGGVPLGVGVPYGGVPMGVGVPVVGGFGGPVIGGFGAPVVTEVVDVAPAYGYGLGGVGYPIGGVGLGYPGTGFY